MKKLYMIFAAGIAALSMNAQALHFTINGDEVANGSRVDVTSYFEDEEYLYVIDPQLALVADKTAEVTASVTLNSGASIPEYDWDYGAEVTLSYCAFDGTCPIIGVGDTVTKSTTLTAGQPANMLLEFMGSIGDMQDPETLVLQAECTVNCTFDGQNYSLVLFVDKTAGINGLTSDNASPVYYDLQGRRIDNPGSGLYIVRQGGKVSKRFVK